MKQPKPCASLLRRPGETCYASRYDIVTVYLVRGDEAEASYVLLKEVREVNIIGTLLSEPQKAYGLHKGDEIGFFLVRNEKGIMCMKVLEG